MSDLGRKDFSTKAQEKMTPDSSKSTAEKIKETVTDATDRLTGKVQPDQDKSAQQRAFDNARDAKDEGVHGGSAQTIGDKAKNALGLGDH